MVGITKRLKKLRVPLKADFIAELNETLARFKGSRGLALKYFGAPETLTINRLNLILNGKVESIDKDYEIFFKDLIENIRKIDASYAEEKSNKKPRAHKPKNPRKKYRRTMLPISQRDIDAINEEINRTGYGPAKLIDKGFNPPEKLKAGMIYRWLSKATENARPEHVSWVILELKRRPAKK